MRGAWYFQRQWIVPISRNSHARKQHSDYLKCLALGIQPYKMDKEESWGLARTLLLQDVFIFHKGCRWCIEFIIWEDWLVNLREEKKKKIIPTSCSGTSPCDILWLLLLGLTSQICLGILYFFMSGIDFIFLIYCIANYLTSDSLKTNSELRHSCTDVFRWPLSDKALYN